MAESNACLSTPLAKPLTMTLYSFEASLAILSVNFNEISEASLDPTIATDFSFIKFLFPLTYKTTGEYVVFKFDLSVGEYSGEFKGMISYPSFNRVSAKKARLGRSDFAFSRSFTSGVVSP